MAGFLFSKCESCDAFICDEIDIDDPEPVICKGCGAKLKPSGLPCTILTGKISHSGVSITKGWLSKISIAFRPQRNRDGATARHERIIDRQKNQYFERATLCESGEVSHHCDEPLTEHQGHGSAKEQPAS